MERSWYDSFTNLLLDYMGQEGPITWGQRLCWMGVIAVVAVLADYICRKLLSPAIKKFVKRTAVTWDDYLFSDAVLNNACHVIPSIVVYLLLPMAFGDLGGWFIFLKKLSLIYITAATLRLICSFLSSLYALTEENEQLKDRPMRGLFQMLKIVVCFVGCVVIVGILIDRSPLTLFAGLGAAATILMLVFKDTIVGLVAGVQLSANDMLRPGDWITVAKAGADGIVEEVTLTTIKIRNYDNTITTVPPYTLVSESFQNWRGMQQSEGRRIKRSLFINLQSIRFATLEEQRAWTEKGWMKAEEVKEGAINLTIFRTYLERYLRDLPLVNGEMTMMVRHLQPTAEGLPLELYFFSRNKNWIPFEHLQADVFDYVLAVLPSFGLRVYQRPSDEACTENKNLSIKKYE